MMGEEKLPEYVRNLVMEPSPPTPVAAAVPDAARREGLAAEVAAVRSAVDPAAPLREMQLSPEELAAFADWELDEIAHEAEELLLDYLSGDLRCGK